MYSFPSVRPVVASSESFPLPHPSILIICLRLWVRLILFVTDMNYVSAVYGVVVFIIVVDWFVRGRRHYRGQVARHDEAIAVMHGVQRNVVH